MRQDRPDRKNGPTKFARQVHLGFELLEDRLVPTNAAGLIDTTFAPAPGVAYVPVLPSAFLEAQTAVQSDGKILVAGGAGIQGDSNNFEDSVVARLNPDGSPDLDFGQAGYATVNLSRLEEFRAVAIQDDGKIVAGGVDDNGHMTIARFLANGTPDPDFGNGGTRLFGLNGGLGDQVWDLALQADGKIVAAGAVDEAYGVIRFNTDGSFDNSFGTGGFVRVDVGGAYAHFTTVRVDSQNRIIAGGYIHEDFLRDDMMAVIRFLPDGTPDPTFGSAGRVNFRFGPTDFSGRVEDLIVQPDGKLLVTGFAGTDAAGTGHFSVIRLRADGTRDATFGNVGLVESNYPDFQTVGHGLALQPDGQIILIGYLTYGGFITRLNRDGSIDHGFGTDPDQGRTVIYLGGRDDFGFISANLQDGDILATGFYRNGATTLARFFNPLPPTVVVTEGDQATYSFEFSDLNGDLVDVSASVGAVAEDPDHPGAWIWSFDTTDGPDETQIVTVTATDSDGAQQTVTFELAVWDAPPTVAVTGGDTVTVDGNSPIANAGTFADLGADLVTITASVGTVEQTTGQSGTWSWSLAQAASSQTVVITATDSDGAQSTATFSLVVPNPPPQVAVTGAASVTVNEGGQATKGGTFADPNGDTVTMSASVGNISKSGASSGTWSWSFNTSDGPDQSQSVTITATDSQGAHSSTTFELTVNNVAPSVSVTGAASVTVNEGVTATKFGSYSDVSGDTVAITASIGTVNKTGTNSGTWSWSFDATDGPGQSQTVTITATDSDGTKKTTTFSLTVNNRPPTIAVTGGATVTVDEGATAANSGTFGDPGSDVVTVSASIGTITQSDSQDGAWSWSLDTTDGPDQSQTVTITATDSAGVHATATFDLVVQNVPPAVSIDGATTVTVNEGAQALKTGTFADAGLDDFVITASSGSIVQEGSRSGTWKWLFDTSDGPDQSRTVVITATDSDGVKSTASFDLAVRDVEPKIDITARIDFPQPPIIGVKAPAPKTLACTVQLGTLIDPGADLAAAYRINWGDGASTGRLEGSPSGASVRHEYKTLGVNRTITVDVYDEEGNLHLACGRKTVALYQRGPDLKTTISPSTAKVSQKGFVTFKITVANNGDAQATGASLTANLPAGLQFSPTGSTAGWQHPNPSGQKYVLPLGTLEPGKKMTVTFRVMATGTRGAKLTVPFSAGDDGAHGADYKQSDNQASATITIK